jgi:hypothetical protein
MAVDQSTRMAYYNKALTSLETGNRNFRNRIIVVCVAGAAAYFACLFLLIPKEFASQFSGTLSAANYIFPVGLISVAILMITNYSLILRIHRYSGDLQRRAMYAGISISGFVSIVAWVLYLPIKGSAKFPILLGAMLAIMFIFLIPMFIIVFKASTDSFFGKDKMGALNAPYARKNIPAFTGNPVFSKFEGLAGLSPAEFRAMFDPLCRFYAANQIIHRWYIEDDYVALFPFFDSKMGGMTLTQGKNQNKASRSAIIIERSGSISFHAHPSDAKTFEADAIRPPVFYEMLQMLINSANNFRAGNNEEAIRWLIGKDKPVTFGQTKKGKFALYYMIFNFVAIPGLLYMTIYHLGPNKKALTTTQIVDFIVKDGPGTGMPGNAKNCTDCGSKLANTTTAVAALSYFGRLNEVNAKATAQYIARQQAANGLIIGDDTSGGGLPATAAAVEALRMLGYINLIDNDKLVTYIARTKYPDGLYTPPKEIALNKYEYSYYCLKILHSLGRIDSQAAAGAWKQFISAMSHPPENLEWYLFDLSRTFGYDITGQKKWIVKRYEKRAGDFMIGRTDRNMAGSEKLATPWQAAEVYVAFREKRSAELIRLRDENGKRIMGINGRPLFIKSYPSIYPYITAFAKIRAQKIIYPSWHRKDFLIALIALVVCSIAISSAVIRIDIADRRNEEKMH